MLKNTLVKELQTKLSNVLKHKMILLSEGGQKGLNKLFSSFLSIWTCVLNALVFLKIRSWIHLICSIFSSMVLQFCREIQSSKYLQSVISWAYWGTSWSEQAQQMEMFFGVPLLFSVASVRGSMTMVLWCCNLLCASTWNKLLSEGWMLSLPLITFSFMMQPASKLYWKLIRFEISLPKVWSCRQGWCGCKFWL